MGLSHRAVAPMVVGYEIGARTEHCLRSRQAGRLADWRSRSSRLRLQRAAHEPAEHPGSRPATTTMMYQLSVLV